MTVQEIKSRIPSNTKMVPADYETALDYFRRLGNYHNKRILVLGTSFQKASSVLKVKPELYVYPVNGSNNNIGWMTMEANEMLTEKDYVLVDWVK